MKILIVSPFENSATGRGDRNLRLESELKSRGYDVTFLTSNFDHALKKHNEMDKARSHARLKVLKLPAYDKNVGFSRAWCHIVCAIKFWIAAIGTRWDAIVISSIPPELLVAAKLLRKKVLVVDVRDIWPDAISVYNTHSIATRLFSIYCDLIYKATLKDAARIIFVAPEFRNWLKRYGAFVPSAAKFVPLGFRREDFRAVNGDEVDFDFCYAGGITPQFDIREFAPDFGNKKGIVVGSGPLVDEWKRAFPNTEFRGPVARNEAIHIMSRSETLLFPSNPFAQLPNKAFDYFALGSKVVVGDGSSRATRYILELRRRRALLNEKWEDYRVIEKESLARRSADIVEAALS